jgi:hypothetical protein
MWGLPDLSRVLKLLFERLRFGQPPRQLLRIETQPAKNIWPPEWEEFNGGLDKIPVGLKEREEVYGVPILQIRANNTWNVDRKFAKNLFTVSSSEFVSYVRDLYVHRKVAPYFVEALRRAQDVCPEWKPKRIGCFNPRRMRHSKNPRVPLSDHTWGIAFDIDSKTNRAWSRKRFPNRQHIPFAPGWDENSDIPEGVVLAFESLGFDWGGRWAHPRNGTFVDPMHFSLRKLG